MPEPLPDHVARNRAYWDEIIDLEVVDLVEVRAPEGASSGMYDLIDPEWAQRYPAEQIWRARKRGSAEPGPGR